jgi:hypothetical protein
MDSNLDILYAIRGFLLFVQSVFEISGLESTLRHELPYRICGRAVLQAATSIWCA